jgi:oligoendopeptidase F
MTKLHFSMAWMSFYNFPYTFGYLFSLNLFARRQPGRAGFDAYNALLRDTGSMTAEDLIRKHLGEDITRPEFWHVSLDLVEQQVAHFENLVKTRAGARARQ